MLEYSKTIALVKALVHRPGLLHERHYDEGGVWGGGAVGAVREPGDSEPPQIHLFRTVRWHKVSN